MRVTWTSESQGDVSRGSLRNPSKERRPKSVSNFWFAYCGWVFFEGLNENLRQNVILYCLSESKES